MLGRTQPKMTLRTAGDWAVGTVWQRRGRLSAVRRVRSAFARSSKAQRKYAERKLYIAALPEIAQQRRLAKYGMPNNLRLNIYSVLRKAPRRAHR